MSKTMAEIVSDLTTIKTKQDETKASLVNIAGDQVNLAQQIQDLKNQIAAGGGNALTPEAETLLNDILTAANTNAANAQTIADSVPDIPVPPPPPPPPPVA